MSHPVEVIEFDILPILLKEFEAVGLGRLISKVLLIEDKAFNRNLVAKSVYCVIKTNLSEKHNIGEGYSISFKLLEAAEGSPNIQYWINCFINGPDKEFVEKVNKELRELTLVIN